MGEAIPNRKIFRISGSEAHDFLQNLVTNDISHLKDGLVYAALLTPQGKYLADFFLVPEGQDILLDVHVSLSESLAQRLALYKLRADVTISPTDLHVQRGLGNPPAGAFSDPRHEALGWRLYGDQPGSAPKIDWDAIRVAHKIPETGEELTPDSFILELGFEALHGVDFKKGCYVGQEVTARMKHKTELRKGLARVAIDGVATPGTPIETEDGKAAGTLHTRAGSEAIAYLRFDRAQGTIRAGDARVTMID